MVSLALVNVLVLGSVLGILAAIKAYQISKLDWHALELFFLVVSGLGWMAAFAAAGELWFS